MPKNNTAPKLSNNLDTNTTLKAILHNPVTEETTFDGDVYKRMQRYAKAKGLGKTQNVTRLAVSYFLDKEGF